MLLTSFLTTSADVDEDIVGTKVLDFDQEDRGRESMDLGGTASVARLEYLHSTLAPGPPRKVTRGKARGKKPALATDCLPFPMLTLQESIAV